MTCVSFVFALTVSCINTHCVQFQREMCHLNENIFWPERVRTINEWVLELLAIRADTYNYQREEAVKPSTTRVGRTNVFLVRISTDAWESIRPKKLHTFCWYLITLTIIHIAEWKLEHIFDLLCSWRFLESSVCKYIVRCRCFRYLLI